MSGLLKLPIGIENFEKIRSEGFYYADKTKLIEQLLGQWGEVNFEIGTNQTLFDGLYIAKNKELCEQYMGKFPVISISLKSVNAENFDKAKAQLVKIINREARRLRSFLRIEYLEKEYQEIFSELLNRKMEEDTLTNSLQEFTELLETYYGEKVIVLIDEYDVPLAKANENGYYDRSLQF